MKPELDTGSDTPRPIAQDIALFLILALFANTATVVIAGGTSARALLWSFYLIAFVHFGATLYHGVFDRSRTACWVILILGWTLAECASFFNYIMPMGQFFFWVATHAPWAQPLLEGLMAAPLIVPIVLLALLMIDVALAYRRRWRGRPWHWLALLIVVAAVAGVLFGVLLPSLLPRPAPVPSLTFDVLPSWHLLPFYPMLRAVPDKMAATATAVAAILLPAIWPWMRAETLRSGSMRWIWFLAWLAFVTAFLGLGYLGAQPPDENMILAARMLTAYYFVFLLVLPPLLRFGSAARTAA